MDGSESSTRAISSNSLMGNVSRNLTGYMLENERAEAGGRSFATPQPIHPFLVNYGDGRERFIVWRKKQPETADFGPGHRKSGVFLERI